MGIDLYSWPSAWVNQRNFGECLRPSVSTTWLEHLSEMELERRSHGAMIPHRVSYTLISNLTNQAFTESPTGLVGLEGSLDFTTSDEHGCGDLASHECSAAVVLFSFDFVSFKTHTWLRNILSNCSFCALRASNSLSRELFSEFKSSLSYKNETDNTSSAILVR